MDDANEETAGLARLRASRDRRNEELEEEGRQLGRKGALEIAEADEVERIAALGDEGGGLSGEFWRGTWLSNVVAAWMDNEPQEVTQAQTEDFLAAFFDRTTAPPDAMLSGFVKGVMEIRDLLDEPEKMVG